ncbi:hypothetical protein [Nocardioides sp.]|uniref:hypothetical protein n=1 Tax=Nocardioides sp. TaxID=35761 RepID=UPI001A311996|nr:hypothetical protein [Nocardioides sp.]MBJ7358678.1 hypothetical protein [Nocardioides sp.]
MPRLELSRGLALSAISALAVTGVATILPAGTASAAGPGVVFVSLFNEGNGASARYDGYDSSVALVAQRLDPAAAIAFEYNLDPTAGDSSSGWTAIAGAPSMVGELATLGWTPDPALTGRQVAVRAVASAAGGTTYSTQHGVAIARAEWGTEAVTAGRAAFAPSTVGFFQQPYADSGRTATRAAVQGLTSATGGTAQVAWWDPASQSLRGRVDAAVRPTELKVSPGTSIPGGGAYSADLDITAFGAADGDVIALAVELDTDDVNVTQLAAQTVGSISANAQDVPAGQPSRVVIEVFDSGPAGSIAGAEVRRMSDGSLVGYTDGDGRVVDSATGGSVSDYYVNTTDADAYEAGTDVTSTTQVYTATASSADPELRDGRVFDDDEYAAGDIVLQVSDDFRLPVAGADVEYRLYPTGSTPPAGYQTATSDAQGRALIPFAPQGPDGSYTLDYHLPSESDQSVTFTAGDAGLAMTPANAEAAPGGQVAVTGTLSVAGTPLSNRRVAAAYTRGIELVPGTTADAALADGAARVLSLTSSTDPLGVVAYVVDDPAEKPQGAETGGKLGLSTLAAAGAGVSLGGNPAETASLATTFGSQKGKAKVKLKGSSAGAKDKLVVKGPDSVLGERVKFFRVVGGKLKSIKAKKLNKKGDTVLKVGDANGDAVTTYVVKLLPSDRVQGSKSKKLKLD